MNVQRIQNAPIPVQTVLVHIGAAADLDTNLQWMDYLAQVFMRLCFVLAMHFHWRK